MEIKNWFKTSPVSASSAANVSLYRSIDVKSMVPSGTLESIDVAKVIKGNYFTAAGYPLNPKRESFALSSSDGRMKVRYFFNFDPIQKRSESSASFMMGGRPVMVRIDAQEYHKAKQIFEAGMEKMRASISEEN